MGGRSAKVMDAFEELSAAGKVRFILQTGDMMYFTLKFRDSFL